jgi:hypothetical protein
MDHLVIPNRRGFHRDLTTDTFRVVVDPSSYSFVTGASPGLHQSHYRPLAPPVHRQLSDHGT